MKNTRKPATSNITAKTRRESNRKTDRSTQSQKVLQVLAGKELTAREVAVEMYAQGLLPYPARAVIQPRITELVEAGAIVAVGEKQDDITGRTVAVYRVAESEGTVCTA